MQKACNRDVYLNHEARNLYFRSNSSHYEISVFEPVTLNSLINKRWYMELYPKIIMFNKKKYLHLLFF